MLWIRRISFLVFIRSKLKEKERYEKFCVWFGFFDVTAVFTACGTGIKNSSESSNSSVSMQTQNINIEIEHLVNLGSDPQAYMLYGSYRNEEEYKMKMVPMRRSMQMIMTI